MNKKYRLIAFSLLALSACTQQPAQVVYKDGDESTKLLAQQNVGHEVSFFPRWNGGNIALADGDQQRSFTPVSYRYTQEQTAALAPVAAVTARELPFVEQVADTPASFNAPVEVADNQQEFSGELTFASAASLPSATSNILFSPQPR